jgi:hypothetical protein
MGWGRTLLLGDIGNRLDIADTEEDIDRLRREIDGAYKKDLSQDQRIDALQAENGELKLYLVAVLRLLTAKGAISTEELTAMVHAVDVEDGKQDGKYDGNIV